MYLDLYLNQRNFDWVAKKNWLIITTGLQSVGGAKFDISLKWKTFTWNSAFFLAIKHKLLFPGSVEK